MSTAPTDAAMFVHVVHTAPLSDAGQTAFREAWEVLCTELHLGEPHRDLPLVPAHWGDIYRETELAASKRPRSTSTSFDRAVLRRIHDDVVVSVALVPGSGEGAVWWRPLEERWLQAEAAFRSVLPPTGLDIESGARQLGECVVFTGEQPVPELTGEVLSFLPDVDAEVSAGFQVDPCLCLWPLPRRANVSTPERDRYVVLAPIEQSSGVGPFVWTSKSRLPQLALQYRMTARIGAIHQEWLADREMTTELALEIDAGVSALRSNVGSLPTQREQLDEIAATTASLQSRLVDLRPHIRRLRQNRLAAAAAVDALRPMLSMYTALATDGPTSPFDDPLHRGEWLCEQLAVDVEVSENDHTSGREMLQDVRATVDRGRSELVRQAAAAQEDYAKRTEQFTVLQTAVIGAIVMFLTAMQSLDYEIAVVPESGQGALLLLLTAFALWPGLIAVRLARQRKGAARTPDSWRARWPEFATSVLAGAAAGWTIDSTLLRRFSWWWRIDEPGRLRTTLIAVAVGAVCVPLISRRLTALRHRREAVRR